MSHPVSRSVMSLASPSCLSQLAASGLALLLALAAFGIFAARRPLGVRLIYARLHADLFWARRRGAHRSARTALAARVHRDSPRTAPGPNASGLRSA